MVELAIATGTAPSHWRGESDEILVTAIDVLAVNAERIRAGDG